MSGRSVHTGALTGPRGGPPRGEKTGSRNQNHDRRPQQRESSKAVSSALRWAAANPRPRQHGAISVTGPASAARVTLRACAEQAHVTLSHMRRHRRQSWATAVVISGARNHGNKVDDGPRLLAIQEGSLSLSLVLPKVLIGGETGNNLD